MHAKNEAKITPKRQLADKVSARREKEKLYRAEKFEILTKFFNDDLSYIKYDPSNYPWHIGQQTREVTRGAFLRQTQRVRQQVHTHPKSKTESNGELKTLTTSELDVAATLGNLDLDAKSAVLLVLSLSPTGANLPNKQINTVEPDKELHVKKDVNHSSFWSQAPGIGDSEQPQNIATDLSSNAIMRFGKR